MPSDVDQIEEELAAILESSSFKQSRRSRDLLRFVVTRKLAGGSDGLKERTIGVELFRRSPDYDTGQDATVRVAANDVRKRLAEYYRQYPEVRYRFLLPVGSYVPEMERVARPALQEPDGGLLPAVAPSAATGPSEAEGRRLAWWPVGAAAAAAAAVVILLALLLPAKGSPPESPDWPLSELTQEGQKTTIVLADVNAAMLGVSRGSPVTLDEYLGPEFGRGLAKIRETVPGIGNIVAASHLTSVADATVALRLGLALGPWRDRLQIRFARDLRPRDLQQGNLIFLGSPVSNPWVGKFEARLNFRERIGAMGQRGFRNLHPRGNEPVAYNSYQWTGTEGVEYATISLLPSESATGTVLLVQGLHQEGTEAAFELLTSENGKTKLLRALGLTRWTAPGKYFEVLVRFRAIGGVAQDTEIAAVRVAVN